MPLQPRIGRERSIPNSLIRAHSATKVCNSISTKPQLRNMKKLIATTLASTLVGLAAYAQGTVNFANLGVGLNAPVTLADGTTKAGSAYMAQLVAGNSASTLAPVG